MTTFKSIDEIILSVAQVLEPGQRLTVSEAAEKYRYVNNQGSYVGPWRNSMTPMMVEPMDTFTSREFDGMAFAGPAQSGKTDSLCVNTIAYTVKCAPMDMMLVSPKQGDARDFSIRRLDRLHRHSEEIGKMLMPGADNDNTFDKQYSNGMLLKLSWPTPSELAGKPIPKVLLTDYDRMDMDVGGDGSPFDLSAKRTTSFGSYAFTLAESSPSKEIKDPKWIAATPHQAPPCEGILALYNRGDRRRWQWPCPHCGQYFEGKFEHLVYTRREGESNLDTAETVRMKCPHCSEHIHPDAREAMQARGRWVKDLQFVTPDGVIHGQGIRTKIASFWLRGVAAVFTDWVKLLTGYLDAKDEFERTGSEEALKKFYNNDLAEPYLPHSHSEVRLPETLKSRAIKLPEALVKTVPAGVRFLVACCDVQDNMWIVQIFGIKPGKPFDITLIDRYPVKMSKRMDETGQYEWVKPHSMLEDWDQLIEQVMEKTYPLSDLSGRKMAVRMTACDSGGREGVTTMAYNFYRRLMRENMHGRFVLVKGDAKPGNPRTRVGLPDSNRKDAMAVARGDVPVLFLQSNLLKDDLNGRLDCVVPGHGEITIPSWMDDRVFRELCTEIRVPDKGWTNPAQRRNEAWDLFYYCIGLCVSKYINIEMFNWDNPPSWATDWADGGENDFVTAKEEQALFVNTIKSRPDFGALAKELA